MLDPDDRHLLVEALKPPPGMALDIAVGTTFTLDLQALLLAPVSFAFFGHDASDGSGRDPLALLESVRRHADRITMFCQAGCITVPRTLQPVLAWLEDAVVPVRPPRPGLLFHPKVWVLRFVDDTGARSHRLLVASRNLTFDTSWDTIVRLDEHPTGTSPSDNAPIQAFLRSLAGNAVQPLDGDRRSQIEDLAVSVGGVEWELPEHCKSVAFWPLGIPGAAVPSLHSKRALVVSPFLSADTVRSLGVPDSNSVVISRPESFDAVGAQALDTYLSSFVIDADTPTIDDDTTPGDPTAGEPDTDMPTGGDGEGRIGTLLEGLHAKLYLLERGRTVHLFTGSTNATSAGLGGNVEFMIELTGRRTDWGIDKTLDAKGNKASLRDMLRAYTPANPEPSEPDEEQQLSRRLEAIVQKIAVIPLTLTVNAEDDEYRLRIHSNTEIPRFPGDVTVTIRPASMGDGAGATATLEGGTRVNHPAGSVTLAGITSFLAITATSRFDGREIRATALANARLVGAPKDRKERLLSAQLTSPDDLIRYLLFLLFDLAEDSQLEQLVAAFGAGSSRWGSIDQIPLFETMLRALAHSPTALDRIADLLDDLRSTEDGAKVIPAGLAEIWGPIDEARQDLHR